MDVGTLTAIIGVVGSIVTGGIGYLSGKNKDKVTDRELLSKDEQAFRANLIERINAYEEKIDKLNSEVVILSREVITLRKENLELISENKQLNSKVEELVSRLSKKEAERRWEDEVST